MVLGRGYATSWQGLNSLVYDPVLLEVDSFSTCPRFHSLLLVPRRLIFHDLGSRAWGTKSFDGGCSLAPLVFLSPA